MESVAEVYKACLDLLKDANSFAQEYYYKDKYGEFCEMDEACSFCALGAIHYVTKDSLSELAFQAQCLLQRVSEYLYSGDVIQSVNDFNTKEDAYNQVIAAFTFAYNLWNGKNPTEEDLGRPVKSLLEKTQNGTA